MPTVIRLAYKVVFDAIWHFSEDDGWAMASHVALSTLLAIFPANVEMAVHAERFKQFPPAALWGRLPLQGVLIAWSWLTAAR